MLCQHRIKRVNTFQYQNGILFQLEHFTKEFPLLIREIESRHSYFFSSNQGFQILI